MSFTGILDGVEGVLGEAGAGTTGLGEAGTGAAEGESAAAGAKAEEGAAQKSKETDSGSSESSKSGSGPSASTAAKGGLAGLLGVAGWEGLLVRALEAIAGFVLIILGLVSMTGGPSNPAAAARKILP